MIKFALSIPLCALVVGCSSLFNPVGQTKYECNRKEDPNSPHCHSFQAVETSTNGDLPKSRYGQQFDLGEYDKLTGIAPITPAPPAAASAASATEAGMSASSSAPQSTDKPKKRPLLPHEHTTEPLKGQPVRVGPIIMRTLVSRYVDDGDRLHESSVVFREVSGNRWQGFAPTGTSSKTEFTPSKPLYPHIPTPAAVAASGQSAATTPPNQKPSGNRNDFPQPGAAPTETSGGPLPD
jgi:conjugal transfer pilus assembly protein TraV